LIRRVFNAHFPGLIEKIIAQVMLKSLVCFASSRRTRYSILGMWVLSLLYMLDHGFLWNWDLNPGDSELRRNYISSERNALFIWITLIIIGYLAHRFRQRFLGYYGLCEIVIGLVGGFVAASKLPISDTSAWLALVTSAFIIVRGASNITEAVAAPKIPEPKEPGK
jgi:hypothetical protein